MNPVSRLGHKLSLVSDVFASVNWYGENAIFARASESSLSPASSGASVLGSHSGGGKLVNFVGSEAGLVSFLSG